MHLPRALAALALVLALALPAATRAKSARQMSESELVAALGAPGGVRKREGIIVELGGRKSVAAIAGIGAACLEEGELCGAALTALGGYGPGEAQDQVESILLSRSTDALHRSAALSLLLAQEPERLDPLLPELLAWYRHGDPALTASLLAAAASLDLDEVGDMAVFMAMDLEADRDVRLAAMETAEKLGHPRIFDVYIALLGDSESPVRELAAEALGGKGYPGAAVVPALRFAARHDSSGAVRSAAILSLRFYAHADLLPVVHHSVLHETNPMAWACSILMLEALADRSSVHPIHELLKRREQLEPSTQAQLIRVLVRIGDLSAVPVLHAVTIRSGDRDIKQAALDAIDLLQGPPEQRQSAVSQWKFGVGVYPWNPDVPRAEPAPLRVVLDDSDVLVWTD